MAPHSSTLAWKIPWMEEPGGIQSMGLLRVRHDWATSLSLFTFMHWRWKWQPTPVFLPWESQGQGSLVGLLSMGSHRVGHDWSDLAAAAAAYLIYGFTLVFSVGLSVSQVSYAFLEVLVPLSLRKWTRGLQRLQEACNETEFSVIPTLQLHEKGRPENSNLMSSFTLGADEVNTVTL